MCINWANESEHTTDRFLLLDKSFKYRKTRINSGVGLVLEINAHTVYTHIHINLEIDIGVYITHIF